MKTCLGRLLWMILGAVGAVVLLVALFVVVPSLGNHEPSARYSPATSHGTQPDVTLTISEAYLNRRVAEVARQAGNSAVTDVVLDLKPGNKVLISLATQVEIVGLALNPTVDLDIRVGIADGTLSYRLESIKIGKVPIARLLLPGPLKASVEAAEQELARATQEQFNKAHFRPVSVKTTEQSIILELQGVK